MEKVGEPSRREDAEGEKPDFLPGFPSLNEYSKVGNGLGFTLKR